MSSGRQETTSRSSRPRVPVTILSGFLGSGKTTLLNRLLRADADVRFAVLVNDFGAINIDARLVDSIERDAINLSNGCVCCSMRGGLVASVTRLLERPNPPEHLLVEASGIADPHGVSAAFTTTQLRELTTVAAVVTLLDAENARNPRVDSQLIEEQVRAADLVVLNKIDLVAGEVTSGLHEWIHSLVPRARVLMTREADVPVALLLNTATLHSESKPQGTGSGEEDVEHRHHIRFESWASTVERPLAYAAVRSALESLSAGIFRAKGVLFLADAPNLRFIMQLVGTRLAIDVLGPWGDETRRSEIVFIGEPGATSPEDLRQLLDSCATDAVPLMAEPGMRLAKERARTVAAGSLL